MHASRAGVQETMVLYAASYMTAQCSGRDNYVSFFNGSKPTDRLISFLRTCSKILNQRAVVYTRSTCNACLLFNDIIVNHVMKKLYSEGTRR